MFSRLARKLDAELPGIEAFIIDDTGFPKRGIHYVGVQRQYSGTLGRVDNCQIGVSLHLAGERGSSCIGMRMYMPREWLDDPTRCSKVGVPAQVTFKTKPEIALEHLDNAERWGVRRRVVLADAGFGNDTAFRDSLQERGLEYIVGIQSTLKVWAPGTSPLRPEQRAQNARGRPKTRYESGEQPPVTVCELATSWGKRASRRSGGVRGPRGPNSHASQRSAFARLTTT